MNANVSESNIIVDEAIVQPNIKEKVEVKKTLYKVVKRLIDILGGLVGCVLLVPITVDVYIARKVLKEDDGPMFYEQLRVGKNGKEFRFYKFRTMVMNADEKLEQYLEENEEARLEYKKYKKLKNDPRITKLGNFLRKTSIDEVPQFINVLKGDMSLVGPRPYLHREIKDMGDNYEVITSVKPGLTGYWQVNGRSETDFETRMKMDMDYIHDRTLWGDTKFLIKTFLKIFEKEGAI